MKKPSPLKIVLIIIYVIAFSVRLLNEFEVYDLSQYKFISEIISSSILIFIIIEAVKNYRMKKAGINEKN